MPMYTELVKDKMSLFEYIKQNLDSHGKLPRDLQQLPDENESMEYWHKEDDKLKGIVFAPGMINGCQNGFDVDTERISAEILSKIDALNEYKNRNDYNEEKAFYLFDQYMGDIYELCMKNLTLSFIDDFTDKISQNNQDLSLLIKMVDYIHTHGSHREPVKFAIELLGMLNLPQEHEVFDNLMILGLSDEFAKFVAMALYRQDQNALLLNLAKRTDGWGKIEYIDKFTPETQEDKLWLVTEGFRNDIMDEYLAYECAIKADLKNIIQNTKVLHGDLYNGVRDIINALLSFSSPREDIEDYDDGLFVIQRFVNDSRTNATTLEDLNSIINIYDFVNNALEDNESKYDKSILQSIYNDTIYITRDESFHWEDKIKQDPLNWASLSVANRIDVDIFEELFEHAKNNIEDAKFYNLVNLSNLDRIKKIVQFAEEELPLNKIATGVSDELGLGSEFNLHMQLNFLLQGLEKFPTEEFGEKLILTALKSPVTNNRNTAMRVLKSAKYDVYKNTEILNQIKENIKTDPYKDLIQKYEDFILTSQLPEDLRMNPLLNI